MIIVRDLVKQYKNKYALRGVNLHIRPGEFVFLVGSSGAGKSTLMKMMYLEERPTRGNVHIAGIDIGNLSPNKIPSLRRCMGIVFQDYRLLPKQNVYENVAFAMRVVGASNKEIRKRVPYVLNLVGLEGKAKMHPNELSGGEQQRVAIARALVNNPTTIIADEPTGNLDPARSLEILMLLEKINELGTTVLIVTHEKHVVNDFSKRVIAIDGGRIISDGLGGYYNYEEE